MALSSQALKLVNISCLPPHYIRDGIMTVVILKSVSYAAPTPLNDGSESKGVANLVGQIEKAGNEVVSNSNFRHEAKNSGQLHYSNTHIRLCAYWKTTLSQKARSS